MTEAVSEQTKSAAPLCVYTALTGGYERLNEQPMARRSGLRFICLTDDPELRSESWECRLVRPAFRMDPVRSQRDLKIRPHLHLPEFDASLYIDNSVVLKQPPEALWAARDIRAGLSLPRHTGRETLLDEFVAVARMGLDDQARIFEQLNHYQLVHPAVLEERPWWTAILLREHHRADVRDFAEIWAAHVLRYSRRDQLSVNVALRESGLLPYVLPLDNRRSGFHRWPVTPGRVRDAGPRSAASSQMPLLGRARALEQRETEVARVRGTLAWRATEPLRWAERRLPLLRLLVRKRPSPAMLAAARRLPLVGPRVVRAELTRRFRAANGRAPRLDPPETYNDHMLARILDERDPRFPTFCDKLAMRELVRRELGEAFVVPPLGVWRDPGEIEWDALPERFVLKATHGSGYYAVVRGAADRDPARLAAKARGWLANDYFDTALEWGYRGLPRRLLAEPLLTAPDGGELLEAEAYVFGGHVALLRVLRGTKGRVERRERWFDRAGEPVEMKLVCPIGPVALAPADFAQVVSAAEAFAAGFAHLRVDFAICAEGVKVNEVTAYSLAANGAFVPQSWDARLGRMWSAAARGDAVEAVIEREIAAARREERGGA
ncbi:ATP-grasp fold amidoligase family protein [Falsiroseomonas sp.]|uniref:ATP-grasp fold amidoligase family protein n=1 Tax=Falsiroseomonas sp. TaxID=2870721 RepID=UPI003568AB6B